MKNTSRFFLVFLFLAAGVLLRLVPHPWNFTPIGAMALLGGAKLGRRPLLAFGIPLGALFLGDLLLELVTGWGFHSGMPVVYGSFAASVVIGLVVGRHGSSPRAIFGGAGASAVLFYLTTNFWMWTVSELYPPTLGGLVACYLAALPFLAWQLAGDIVFAGIFFGAWTWIETRLASDRPLAP